MTRNRKLTSYAALAASLALGTVAAITYAQTPAVETPAPSVAQPADTQNYLTLTEIESRLAAQGIRVTEVEVKDRVLEIEGTSTKEGKLDLIVDRRTGEILSKERDD